MKILRFGLVGIINTVVDCALLNIFVLVLRVFTPGGLVLCNVFSFLGANVNSYVMNKKWTFRHPEHASQKEYLVFLVCSLGGLGINSGMIFILSQDFFDLGLSFFLHLNLAKIAATVVSMLWNFFSYKLFVFKDVNVAKSVSATTCHRRSVTSIRG
ncbi:membrane protein, GtrA superfamily [Syntrophotalea carbinolica DSM 2380]|uniref:Membrane protein, GtrA superfamily n=1 Tax=Syntrophotalea carbinolica (strain DSM 2380 / NBRC 103641 / GraBd1) TaxID=338963 RepID=Q3A3S1_SYNC1|nr:GtrA family protein [Syntrophotalea carbinolica]ABA88986.1 membrane protein, GtrA superfamily [Syntrophotalea carbinolica DSM 2380]